MNRLKSILPLLIFAGILWGCETTDPLVNDVQVGLVSGNYEMALEATEQALTENPENSIAHYYKGLVLATQAEGISDPAERRDLYEQSKSSFDRAKELMEALPEEERPSEYQELDDTVISFWAEEFNSGVNILTDDSLNAATPQPNETALSHFQNAVTINPDSSRTYQVISSTYFNMGNMEQAISSYEEAMERLENPTKEDYEYLISLYLQDGPYDKAIELAQQAREDFPDETVFVQFQVDAYIQSGERERAIELVQGLIEQEPNNPQYRRVLGTQVYQDVTRISNEVTDLYGEMFELNQELRNLEGSELEEAEQEVEEIQSQITEMESQIDELVDLSAQEMKKVVELEPEDESANYILGIIYQNYAANLFERRNNITDNEQAREFDERARENLRTALTYYERAAELNPDDPEYWQSLFQVYTTLGMEEEAQEAMEKAGL
jgi:tetratricopeptide (TPR) repeat protein